VIIEKKIKATFARFCTASGGMVNHKTFAVYGWSIDQIVMEKISRILGYHSFNQWESFKYLGIPITQGQGKVNQWTGIIEKIQAKIKAWGGLWLNHAWKLVLIKSFLSTILMFQSSLLLEPASIISLLSKFLKRFLWQGGKNNQWKK
jgi:hypothetical protein